MKRIFSMLLAALLLCPLIFTACNTPPSGEVDTTGKEAAPPANTEVETNGETSGETEPDTTQPDQTFPGVDAEMDI